MCVHSIRGHHRRENIRTPSPHPHNPPPAFRVPSTMILQHRPTRETERITEQVRRSVSSPSFDILSSSTHRRALARAHPSLLERALTSSSYPHRGRSHTGANAHCSHFFAQAFEAEMMKVNYTLPPRAQHPAISERVRASIVHLLAFRVLPFARFFAECRTRRECVLLLLRWVVVVSEDRLLVSRIALRLRYGSGAKKKRLSSSCS